MRTRVPFAVAYFLTLGSLLACSGDSTMGPDGPSTAQVGGVWTYAASNVAGGGASCTVTNLRLTFVQSGTTFSGSYSGGTMTCAAEGESATIGPFQGTVVNGTIDGNRVSFDLDTQDWHNSGTLSGSSMSGQVTVRIDLGDGPITLSGSWSAAR